MTETPAAEQVEEAAASLEPPTEPETSGGGGVNPFVVLAVAFLLGLVIARLIAWQSHEHD